jgi:hypothetical protein
VRLFAAMILSSRNLSLCGFTSSDLSSLSKDLHIVLTEETVRLRDGGLSLAAGLLVFVFLSLIRLSILFNCVINILVLIFL